MARELSATLTRVVISGDATAPASCAMEYSVLAADGTNDDLLETPKNYPEPSPDFNQTVNLLCSGVGTTVKANESIV